MSVLSRYTPFQVNTDKTQIIAFGSRQNMRNIQRIEVNFSDAVLKPCMNVKNLGVTLYHLLTWDSTTCHYTVKALFRDTGCLVPAPTPCSETVRQCFCLSRVHFFVTALRMSCWRRFLNATILDVFCVFAHPDILRSTRFSYVDLATVTLHLINDSFLLPF